MKLTTKDLRVLEDLGIIEARGTSGKLTTVKVAVRAPTVCQIHAMSGKVFDVTCSGETVELTEVTA